MESYLLGAPPVDSAPLGEQAYYAIRELIVSLELAPGAVIEERRLTERLGSGRTPVHEALRRLAQEQLVEVYPRRGMFVADVDVRDLARISEVRALLEAEGASSRSRAGKRPGAGAVGRVASRRVCDRREATGSEP